MVEISEDDVVESIRRGLQFISCFHPKDYLLALGRAYAMEQSAAAKEAIGQILVNSRLAAIGHRPMCQDTGTVSALVTIGMDVRISSRRSLQELVDEGVRQAYRDAGNPLRASMVGDPLYARKNTKDNTPAMVTVSLVSGPELRISLMAKGGGSENKAKLAMLEPSDDVVTWVVETVERLGAGWCPPGMIGLGVGGTADKAMMLAKQSLLQPIDMPSILARGPSTPEEALRVELYEKINALGIGAQGLGGLTTVVDVKLMTFPCHAASKPVGLVPQCAANRHVTFTLDGSGPMTFDPPDLADWPEVTLERTEGLSRRVDLDRLTAAEVASWRQGQTLLLSGTLLTARDAAHARLVELLAEGRPLPVDLAGRVVYYVGPVDPVGAEVVGPAGPTTATRMDRFTEPLLAQTGLLAMIGKAERGPDAIASIRRHARAYLVAVGGAAILVAKAVRQSRVVAFPELGMEAIHEFVVEDMPVMVAVDAEGRSVHSLGPARWRASA